MDKRFENLNRQDRSTIIKVLNEKLALAFFSASIAFNVLDNPYVKDFIETLSNTNVSYKPPCRQTLASTILDLLHEKIINEKIKFTTGTDSVLLVDGWLNKSSKKKLLVFTIRNIYADQIFLTYKDFSMQSEDGDNLALHITAAIDYAKEKYDTDVFGIITDNDSKIKCGARNSVNVQDAFLWQATCSSHSANLFLKSFVNPELVLQIIKVVDNFSKPFFDSLLRSANYKGTKIQSYPETRFGYIQLTCQSILNNLKKMREIANDPSIKLDENVFEILHDDDFEKQLRSTLQDIDPVCKLITKCQDPKKNIADATQYWLTLEVPNKYRDLLKERIENAVSPVGLAANILHHKYRGLMLNNTQTIVGQNFIDT